MKKVPLADRNSQARARATAGSPLLDDVLIADSGSGSVVLHLRSGVYFELDRSATEVLRLT